VGPELVQVSFRPNAMRVLFALTTNSDRRHEMFSVRMVEVCDAFAGKFEVLLLVLTHRYMCCAVEWLSRNPSKALRFIPMNQYISCLQDGIRKKT
jgi:hypothetical protein